MSNKQPATLAPPSQGKLGASLLCAIVVFVVTAFTAISDYPTQKMFGLLGAIALILFFAMSGAERLRHMTSPLALAAMAYVGWAGISTLYARSGKFAIAEFSCLLAAFTVFAAIVLFAGKDESGFRRIAAGLAAAAAPVGILSIDAASLNVLMRPFRAILSITTDGYGELGGTFYSRLQTIFGNPNTYAGLMSIACLLSLYLVLSAQTRRQKILSTVLLTINVVSYLLAFSMGSLGVFVVSCLLLLALCPGGDKRVDCLLLLVQTAVIALAVSMIAVRGFGDAATGSPLPLLMLAAGCAAAVVLEVFVRGRIVAALAGRGKAMLIAGGGVAICIVAYLIIGLQIAGPYTFGQTTNFLRATDLAAGDYTLTVTASGPVTVDVYYKSTSNLVQNNQTDLVSADAGQPISFTIPEDSRLAFFRFSSAEPGTVVESAGYTGASEGAVKLNYKLLPAFVADRVQDLSANGNVVQRQVYLQDALRLFQTSPAIGRGLGGFQNGVVSVQDYYYETKFAHNHYAQMLCDLGIVGLITFLALLVCAVWSLLKSRKSKPAIVAVLAACVLQMFLQAWTDLTWSVGVCMSMFFGVLALISLYCGDARVSTSKVKKPTALRASTIAYCTVVSVLIGLNLIAQSRLHGGNLTLQTLKSNASIDFFEANDHKLSYLLSGGSEDDAETAERYADDLSRVQSNSIGIPLAQYYMQTIQFDKALDVLDTASDYMRADEAVWQQLFTLYEQMLDPTKGEYNAVQLLQSKERFTDRMKATYDKLCAVNADQLDNVLLTPQNNTFVSKLLAAAALPAEDIANALRVFETLMIDTKTAPDVDADGAPDYAKTTSGQVTWHADGSFTADQDSVIELTATAAYEGDYYLSVTSANLAGITGASQGNVSITIDPATGRSTENMQLLGGDTEKTITLLIKQGTTVDRVQYTRVKPNITA